MIIRFSDYYVQRQVGSFFKVKESHLSFVTLQENFNKGEKKLLKSKS